jgi:hypothetical protein
MNANSTIEAVKEFCTGSSSDPQIWSGNKATYHWNIGKVTQNGTVNGVVRKLAGIDVSGKQIWVVAGSLKIAADGTILRFTGLPKKIQTKVVAAQTVQSTAWEKVTV